MSDQRHEPIDRFDVIVIGAGMSGMYQLHKLRQLGLSARVFEAGSDVGGTWYWNRYPGARFDSESYSYGYSFSKEVLEEWEWSEHFAPQAETLRYLNYVADKFDLRRDIQFNTRIASARYDETANEWEIKSEEGAKARARFLITAMGALSAPTTPRISGIEDFRGEAHHTAHWPHEPVSFEGKRVGVIGTGATGVQTIQEVAKTAGHLTVFQRTPNYCAPLVNSPIDADTQKEIKASYDDIFKQCAETNGAFLHKSIERNAVDVPEDERNAIFEELYAKPGFAIWMGNFQDIVLDERASEIASDFIRKKIRERVNDPEVAEMLCPTDHGFGMRRVPMETNYYEVYNRDNVELVDVRATPIDRITEKGLIVGAREFELDMLIYATGFDAITGAFDRMDIIGKGGLALRDKWADGPKTYLGIQTVGFPNMFTLVGPHNAATFCNIPRCIEQNVEWVTDFLRYMQAHNLKRAEATEPAAEEWTDHVYEMVNMTLLPKANSWFMGVNQNLPDKKKTFLAYAGGAPRYREKCDEVAANGYEGFDLS
jgi:cation diffusion facilitator CzcD-associated flavoprotein CzcO